MAKEISQWKYMVINILPLKHLIYKTEKYKNPTSILSATPILGYTVLLIPLASKLNRFTMECNEVKQSGTVITNKFVMRMEDAVFYIII